MKSSPTVEEREFTKKRFQEKFLNSSFLFLHLSLDLSSHRTKRKENDAAVRTRESQEERCKGV